MDIPKQSSIKLIHEYLYRDKLDDKLVIEICNFMLEGNLVVRYGHVPKSLTYHKELQFTPETINWNMKYANITGLCQLYLHSLEPVKVLLQGYLISNEIKYIELAGKIIKSWLLYASVDTSNKFTWYDHCVSDRALYLVCFVELVHKNNITKFNDLISSIKESIYKHGDFLFNDENYTTQNHGTMMDRTLYLLSFYNNVNDWRLKALERLKQSVRRDYSSNMVNLENSSSYHLFNFDLYVNIEKGLLNTFGDSLGENFQSDIDKGISFLLQLSKPDLYFPMIGDGVKTNLANIKRLPCFKYIKDNPGLKYVLSKGSEGLKPDDTFRVYPEEGYAFFRTSWNYDINDTYASFTAGYQLRNHKHGDDLSFTLFAKGKDIFVDCGTYTYEPGDYRRHFLYSLAHNTIFVDGSTYPFLKGDPSDTEVLDYGENKEYFYIIAKNDMYAGVNITRSFYFLKSGSIIIIDDIASQRKHTYSQLFNLSHTIKDNKISAKQLDDTSCLEIVDQSFTVQINQLQQTDLIIHRGDKNRAGIGLISERFNSLEETTSLEYQKHGRNTRFVTTISVSDNDSEENINAFLKDDNILVVKEGNNSFEIRLQNHVRDYKKIPYLDSEKLGPTNYQFTIMDAKDGADFAWYILKDGERIDTIWYTYNPTLNYTFSKPGTYEIQYFIRKGTEKDKYRFEEKIDISLSDIQRANNLSEVSNNSLNFLTPEITKLSTKKYVLNLNSQLINVEYAWYVLKNGERIDTIWYTSSDKLEYMFEEEGDYKIEYFIRDKNNNKVKAAIDINVRF